MKLFTKLQRCAHKVAYKSKKKTSINWLMAKKKNLSFFSNNSLRVTEKLMSTFVSVSSVYTFRVCKRPTKQVFIHMENRSYAICPSNASDFLAIFKTLTYQKCVWTERRKVLRRETIWQIYKNSLIFWSRKSTVILYSSSLILLNLINICCISKRHFSYSQQRPNINGKSICFYGNSSKLKRTFTTKNQSATV